MAAPEEEQRLRLSLMDALRALPELRYENPLTLDWLIRTKAALLVLGMWVDTTIIYLQNREFRDKDKK